MAWRPDQIARLQLEWQILEHEWPGWAFDDGDDGAQFRRTMCTNYNNNYRIMILATPNFPYAQPKLYVQSPLPKVDTFRHHDHTLGRNKYGQELCGYDNWESDNTVMQSALRIREWLEAYDTSRATSKRISDLLD